MAVGTHGQCRHARCVAPLRACERDGLLPSAAYLHPQPHMHAGSVRPQQVLANTLTVSVGTAGVGKAFVGKGDVDAVPFKWRRGKGLADRSGGVRRQKQPCGGPCTRSRLSSAATAKAQVHTSRLRCRCGTYRLASSSGLRCRRGARSSVAAPPVQAAIDPVPVARRAGG